MAKILIAGSGKTALDIGFYFMDRDHTVYWVTGSSVQKATLEKQLAKYQRRRLLLSSVSDVALNGGCFLLGDTKVPAVDVIIEASSEILTKKQQLFAACKYLTTPQTLLFSNSSSFLPQTLYPRCLGAHFLFPLLLTNLVELIVPPDCSPEKQRQAMQFFRENCLDIITQSTNNGFLINRLLLPLQAECCKAIQQGIPLSIIDEASKCGLFPIGQLSLMDRVGLDIIHSAALQYTSYIEPEDIPSHEVMLETIGKLIQLGKKGKKNRDGLLTGQSLPWSENSDHNISLENLTALFLNKLQTRCHQALARAEITPEELATVFTRVYQVSDFQLSDLLNL